MSEYCSFPIVIKSFNCLITSGSKCSFFCVRWALCFHVQYFIQLSVILKCFIVFVTILKLFNFLASVSETIVTDVYCPCSCISCFRVQLLVVWCCLCVVCVLPNMPWLSQWTTTTTWSACEGREALRWKLYMYVLYYAVVSWYGYLLML